ncbi:MAG: hypothetical protein ACYCV0_00640 [Desulfitobacteriaceae bacterium]
MILNYRVEICRQCYFKRTGNCSSSDSYIQNLKPDPAIAPGGECSRYTPVPWLPQR